MKIRICADIEDSKAENDESIIEMDIRDVAEFVSLLKTYCQFDSCGNEFRFSDISYDVPGNYFLINLKIV